MKASFVVTVLLICLSARAMAADRPEEQVAMADDAGTAAGGRPAPMSAHDAAPDTLAEFLVWADALLLAGEALPVDLPLRMALLAPADRLMGIVHLRRSGLLSGASLPLDTLLAPRPAAQP